MEWWLLLIVLLALVLAVVLLVRTTRNWLRGVLGLLILFLGVVLTGTSGGISYFSPYSLEVRSQEEFTIFSGEIPLYRSSPTYRTPELMEFLVKEGFAQPVEPERQRWLLFYHSNGAWKDGGTPLEYLMSRQRHDLIEWSLADRERAALYWSEGFRLLRSELKADVVAGGLLLSIGWHCETIEELREKIAAAREEGTSLYGKAKFD